MSLMSSLQTGRLIFAFLTLYFICVYAATTFNITNNCAYTLWPAAFPGGGIELGPGKTWTITVSTGQRGRIWARTNCKFDASGRGICDSGDCNGTLHCEGYGLSPCTIAEYTINSNGIDYFDISLLDGFNVPIEFRSGCSARTFCSMEVYESCPTELRDPAGCQNPCSVFENEQFCCTSGPKDCGRTAYSDMFKRWCPYAYAYPFDDVAGTFFCSTGTDYTVVFCP